MTTHDAQHAHPTAALRGELGSIDLIIVGTGAIIGVGWVIMIGAWLGSAGPGGTILAFLIAAAAVMLVGYSYGVMAAAVPRAGGEIIYTYMTLGVPAAFAIGWLIAFNLMLICSFEAIAAGWLLESIFPSLVMGTAYEVFGTSVSVGTLAIGLLGTLLIAGLDAHGSRTSARFQKIFTVTKLMLAAALFVACIAMGDSDNLQPLLGGSQWRGGGVDWRGILTVLAQAPFFLAGFQVIPQLVEERAQNVRADSIGRAIALCLAVALCFYICMIVAIAIISPRTAAPAGELTAYVAVRNGLQSSWAGNALLAIALLGTLSTWNAVFVWSTRTLFALSRAHLAPAFLVKQADRAATPTGAILFTAFMSAGGILLGRGLLSSFVNAGSIVATVAMLITCVCAWRLKGSTNLAKTSRTRLKLCAAITAASLMLAISLATPALGMSRIPIEWLVLIVWTAIIALLWFSTRRRRSAIVEEERRRLLIGV